jgi:hypothetical protein
MTTKRWIPEIMYEEGQDGESSSIPFIMVPKDEEMPSLLYVFESRETESVEPGMEGEEVPIVEWDLHQYADMAILKSNLDMNTYDKVRIALNLEPMSVAIRKGNKISNTIIGNIDKEKSVRAE